MKMKNHKTLNQLPLLPLFKKLQQAGFCLGINDYNLFLEVCLNQTEIIDFDLQSLKYICQTLWVKSREQQDIFDNIWSESLIIIQNRQRVKPILVSKPESSPPDPVIKNPIKPPLLEEYTGEYWDFSRPKIETKTIETETENLKIGTAFSLGKPKIWTCFQSAKLEDEYIPVNSQQMQQGWYQICQLREDFSRLELDIKATIEETKNKGRFFQPILKPRLKKHHHLMLIIDQKGSMLPFKVLSDSLLRSALQTGCLIPANCYYFSNLPYGELFADPDFNDGIDLGKVSQNWQVDQTVIFIISDGGAGRNKLTPQRVRETKQLLQQWQKQVKNIIWLNPLPKSRWWGNSAGEIAKFIDMFPLDRQGFQAAINKVK
jgi:uncharacterized protein with von Willebrand factor type A (vWA) domain